MHLNQNNNVEKRERYHINNETLSKIPIDPNDMTILYISVLTFQLLYILILRRKAYTSSLIKNSDVKYNNSIWNQSCRSG